MGKHRAAKAPPAVPLLDHVMALLAAKDLRDEQRFLAQSSAIAAALLAAEKAVTKAETATERRFDSVNEFRATLTDQAATFMPRVEAEARLTTLAEKIDDQRKTIDGLRELAVQVGGRSAGLNAGWSYLIAAVGAVGVIVAIIVALH